MDDNDDKPITLPLTCACGEIIVIILYMPVKLQQLISTLYSPIYTRPLNCFGSQLSLSWLRVNALNRFTNRYLNRFVNHVWEVV